MAAEPQRPGAGEKRSWPWQIAAESGLVVVLILVSAWHARAAFNHAAAMPDFHYLSPAIGVATGRGLVDPVPAANSPLEAFLAGRATEVSWANANVPEWREAEPTARSTRYLITLVGWSWRWFGISLTSLGYAAEALHLLAVVGAYLLLRMIVPLPLATAGALWMATTTLSLKLIPHVRDYSKGAFIVAALPLIVALALRTRSRVALVSVAALTGALAGIGVGFKMDAAIAIPLAAMSIVLFRGRRPWHDLADKGLGLAALGIAFILAVAPILWNASSGGSNAFHVILLGWAESFGDGLGLNRTAYAILPFYSDDYLAMTIQAMAGPPSGEWLRFPSPDYDAAGLAVWFDLARTFPADVLTRILGATTTALNLVFLNPDPSFMTQPLPGAAALTTTYTWLHRFNGWGAWIGLGFIAAAAVHSVRSGLLAAWLLLAVGGYSFLQFSDRHYFHTQVIAVTAILGMAWSLMSLPGWLMRSEVAAIRAGAFRGLAVPAATALGLVTLTTGLRAYQGYGLEREFTQVQRTQLSRMPVEVVPTTGGSWLAQWPEPASVAARRDDALHAAYYLVEFFVNEPTGPIVVGVAYESGSPARNYSRTLTINPAAGVNMVGFAAFSEAGQTAFRGIELGPEARRHFVGVHHVPAGPAGFTPDLHLPADWRTMALHQRFRFESPVGRPLGPLVRCAGLPGCHGQLAYFDALRLAPYVPTAATVSFVHSPIVRPSPTGISIDGIAENDSSYLVQFHDWTTPMPGALVVRGRLVEGGVAIGLLKDRRWYRQVVVTEPGEFMVSIPVDEPGTYQPLVTNAMPPGQRRSLLTLDQVATIGTGELPR